MLPDNVDCIFIDTGNVINLKEFKRKATLSPTEEVLDSVKITLQTWLENHNKDRKQDSLIFCKSSNHIKVNNIDRKDLKISVKIFLESYNPGDLNTAINQVMSALDVEIIDSLIIAFPPLLNDQTRFDLSQVKPIWNVLEHFVQENKISTIGISDLDTQELAELYDLTQVKPSINQVNLESCCVMPPEMITFAKEKDIQLLTHNDPKVLLSESAFQNILETSVSDPLEWGLSWIVRYSVVVKCRGIIQNKGYLLCTQKRTHR